MHGASTRTLNLPRAWNLEEQWLSIAPLGGKWRLLCPSHFSLGYWLAWSCIGLVPEVTVAMSLCSVACHVGKTLFHRRYPLLLAPGINLHHLPWCSLDFGVCWGRWYKCIDTCSLHLKQLRVSVLTSTLHTKMLLSGGLRATLGYGVVMLLQWCICGRHLGTVSV